jgi:phage terminase small subunit
MNPRRQRFIHEYLKDLNGTQAAIRAGYSTAGASVTGARLLANASVKAAVESALARRAVKVEAKTDDVLRELLRLATVDVGLAYDKNGALLPLHKMPEDVRRTISGIETEEMTDQDGNVIGRLKKVKFTDKKGPLELLGKHLRMFGGEKPANPDEGADVRRFKPDEAKALLKELRKQRKGHEPDPDSKH